MNKLNGFLYGLLSSASFGLIPLFTIPAMREGMNFESILFYRFLFALPGIGMHPIARQAVFPYQAERDPVINVTCFSVSDVRSLSVLGI